MPAVKVENISKSYGKTVALDGVSFEVEQGELFDTGRQKRRTLEKTVFALNKKMGKGVVAPARLLDIRGNALHPDKK